MKIFNKVKRAMAIGFCLALMFSCVAKADDELDSLGTTTVTVDDACDGLKNYFTQWCSDNDYDGTQVPDKFWEMLAMYTLGMDADTKTDYNAIDYNSLTAVQLSEYIIAMIIDGVYPNEIISGDGNMIELLESWKQADGSFRNPDCSSDYGTSYYDQDLPLFVEHIVGIDIDESSIEYYQNFVGDDGSLGMDWGGWWPDGSATSQAVMLSDISGYDFASKSDAVKYLRDNVASTSDVNAKSWWIEWKLYKNKRDDIDINEYLTDYDDNVGYFNVGYDPHYSTKEAARAVATYKRNKSFLKMLKKDYSELKDEANKNSSNTSDSSSGNSSHSTSVRKALLPVENAASIEISKAVSGQWNYNALTDTWSFEFNGQVASNQWVAAVNPYSGGKASWFYFNASGEMLTGWQKIKSADGIERWYFLSTESNGWRGACYLDTTTPDGYRVDASGAWIEGTSSNGANGVQESGGESSSVSEKKKTSSDSEEKESNKIVVDISVDGSLGDRDGEKAFEGSGSVELKKNSSVYTALKALAKEEGWSIGGSSSYVSSINGLKEKANGALSGWMFYVNGEAVNKSAGACKLEDGDSVEWVFVEEPVF